MRTCVKTQVQVKAIAVYVAGSQKAWLYFRFCVKHILYVSSYIINVHWSWDTLQTKAPKFTFAFGLAMSLKPALFRLHWQYCLDMLVCACVCVCVFCACRLILCNRRYDAMNFTMRVHTSVERIFNSVNSFWMKILLNRINFWP